MKMRTLEEKRVEYENMINSHKRSVVLQVPNGPTITCSNAWDYKTNLTQTSLKTTRNIKESHDLLKVEQIDLLPVSTEKVYLVTVLRKSESNLRIKQENDKEKNSTKYYL